MWNGNAIIAELWRYPAKGMRGERVDALRLDEHGIAGDRRWAIRSTGAPHGKPMLSGAERAAMLLFSASIIGGRTEVAAPDGERFDITNPALLRHMERHLPGHHTLALVQSTTPMTDVRPIAVLGSATVRQLSEELGTAVDPRRFRANILLNLSPEDAGFAEDALVGCTVRLGKEAMLRITERDPRCRIVTLDPATAVADPSFMKHLDRRHEGRVGVYATVERTGELHVGDAVLLR
jgi:hypothetical protein